MNIVGCQTRQDCDVIYAETNLGSRQHYSLNFPLVYLVRPTIRKPIVGFQKLDVFENSKRISGLFQARILMHYAMGMGVVVLAVHVFRSFIHISIQPLLN